MTTRYTIQPGDTVSRIAGATGLAPDTIWQHPDNAGLREKREHMDVLAVGDVLTIPARRRKEVACSTGRRHSFRLKGVPMPFVLQLLDTWGEPRSDRPFRLDVDGLVIEGRTDGRGVLRVYIPNAAKTGTLVVDDLTLTLGFGLLEPADTLHGVQQRLTNLGFPCMEDAGASGGATVRALLRFQRIHGLPTTGTDDEATRRKLGELYRELDKLSAALTEAEP